MSQIIWVLFCKSEKEVVAERIIQKVTDHLEMQVAYSNIEKYHKGGLKVTLKTDCSEQLWEQKVYEVLLRSQSIGRHWILSGSVVDGLDIWSNDPKISGIEAINVLMNVN
jgi:hypothetical protein